MKRRMLSVILFASLAICCFCSSSFAAAAAQSGAATGTAQSSCVNINTATADQLQALPGIGPAIAAAIVQHRQQNGPFAAMDDLKKVKGIGDKKFEKIKNLICI
ncbi:MAG: hypothetical protein COT06_06080 [Syntrophobacteraceae bacterium CG07_land_8_20_14_0_80_61_8]|nr:MAG: hypothetical protein COT06_06080 [Syntrophobacteraceae bacterium CG07_land_8_20_14_0_80_61_8]